jgi:aminopeptidase N
LRSTRLSLLIISLALALSAGASAAATSTSEPFFPQAGDPDLNVYSYRAVLSYQPADGRIRVTERVSAYVNRGLRRFSLDLYGLHVRSVKVNGAPATFKRGDGKLRVTMAKAVEATHAFDATIRYDGRPAAVTDPDGTKEGWIRTDDGAVALGEPQGTAAWLACNDVPGDKAAFQLQVIVPRPLVAVANGHLSAIEPEGRRRAYEWRETRPMSPYLALVDIGRGRLARREVAGLPAWTLADPRLVAGSERVLDRLPEVVRFESRLYGGYPFDALGSVVDYAPEIGYALETQTRPFYPYVPDLTTVVHETAHQWFGDSVGLKRWPEIWLNEGFATWTEWYYAERHGRRSAHAIFNRLYRVPASKTAFWNPPSGHPGSAKHLFGPSVYIRGAMALEALRLKIGTKPMLAVLHDWAVAHRFGSADIDEFIALAEEVSGQDLDAFFERWLYRRGKP